MEGTWSGAGKAGAGVAAVGGVGNYIDSKFMPGLSWCLH